MTDENKKTTRRKFLNTIGIAGASGLAGGMAVYSASKYEARKTKSAKIKALTADHKVIEVDESGANPNNTDGYTLTDKQRMGREGIPGKRFVMVIDLAKCKNARKCMAACQSAHNLHPDQHHLNVIQMQDNPNSEPYFMPKPCMQCDNPPCTAVCPVDATFKRQDGIVLIDNERCIGCRFCVAGCPYNSRTFHWREPNNSEEDLAKDYDMELNVPQRKGTVTKCLFSADKCRVGELPYCVDACPNGVYWFGDENEDVVTNGTTNETVPFKKLINDNAAYTLMPELGTKPRVYYLPHKRDTQA